MPADGKPPKFSPNKQHNPFNRLEHATLTAKKNAYALGWKSIKHKSCPCQIYFAGACMKWGPPPPKE